MLGEKRQRRAGPEDDGEEMGELAGEAKEQMLAAHLLDMVGPKLRQPARGLSLEEAGGGSFQTGESLVGGEPVDVHGGGGDVVRSRHLPVIVTGQRGSALTLVKRSRVQAQRGPSAKPFYRALATMQRGAHKPARREASASWLPQHAYGRLR